MATTTLPLETDFICWAIDPITGDLIFPIVWLSGIPAIVQGVTCRLRLFLGEWFLKLTDGVDWQDILGEKFNETLLYTEVSKQILATPGVTGIVSLTATFDNPSRAATVTFVASSEFGNTPSTTLTVP
jgi:hypothetical protein